MSISQDQWPPWVTPPPRGEDLPYDDGEPLESNRHALQQVLLREVLEYAWAGRTDFFVGTNMFLYYSALQAKKNDFRGPDVFVVLGGTEHRDRNSWVIWEEDGRHPDVIIELTSESTAAEDRGPKKRIYGTIGVPEYFIYDPASGALEGYRLQLSHGSYVPITEPAPPGRLGCKSLGLELGVWQGPYDGFPGPWLRWFSPMGMMLPTRGEALVAAERERAVAERERAAAEERARQLAERLAAYELRFGKLPEGG